LRWLHSIVWWSPSGLAALQASRVSVSVRSGTPGTVPASGPLLHQRDGSGPPHRLWPHPYGQVARDSALPGPDHGQDPCHRPVANADDQCAQNRSGRAGKRTHSRSLPRNGTRPSSPGTAAKPPNWWPGPGPHLRPEPQEGPACSTSSRRRTRWTCT
jgi:hypothetical protein